MQAALLTGCRYSELANLICADFNHDSDTLTLRQTKGGRPRHAVLTEEGRKLFAQWTAGRAANERMFLRSDGQSLGCVPPTKATRRGGAPGHDLPCPNVSHSAAHPCLDARYARRAFGRHRRTAWPSRHAHDREALCAPRTELCGRDYSGTFSGAWYCRSDHRCSNAAEELIASRVNKKPSWISPNRTDTRRGP